MNEDDIASEIEKISLECLLSYKKDEANERTWSFLLRGKKREWNVFFQFFLDFPHSFPYIGLLSKEDIGSIAHVNRLGEICVFEGDSYLINISDPSKLIEFILQETTTTLDKASMKISQIELTDEFEGYFHFDGKYDVNSFYKATNKVEYCSLNIIQENSNSFSKKNAFHKPILLLNQQNEFPSNFSNVKQAHSTAINIIHLPLEIPVMPPKNAEAITPKYIQEISAHISLENKAVLSKLFEKAKSKKEFFLLISTPRREHERSQLLLRYYAEEELPHPLLSFAEQWKIDIYRVQRNTEAYLLERGGAHNLSNKKVTIVGCGSVGGEIAYMLAKAGVGELTLIDNDYLKADNIHRHRLGGFFLEYAPNDKGIVKDISKVLALKFSIQKDLPYVKVNPKKNLFETVLSDADIVTSDLVIVAVGAPTKNLQFNSIMKNQMEMKHAIFCWNEAASYGGHSVYVNFDISCLECLYTDEEGFFTACKLNFLAPGQSISKNLTGCAGVFTPFSYLDSSQTAMLSAKQAIQVLLGQDINSRAISWRGTGSSYPLRTTARYNDASFLMLEEPVIQIPHCKVCNNAQ